MLMYRYYSITHAVIRLLSSSQKFNRFLVTINCRLVRHSKECALTHINMSIIEKVFYYEETERPVIKRKDGIWFRGKTKAEILGYPIQHKAIRDHVEP